MPEPIHGNAVITIDDKFLTAHVVVNEPEFGGHPYTYEMLCDELIMHGIRYNVFHDDLKRIFEEKIFGRSVLAAKGEPPVDGENGSVKYYFDCSNVQVFEEDEYGNVDYRDLGLVTNIEEGTVIAEITPPTEGEPGKDIRGIVAAQTPGKPALLNIGAGTKLSEDGLFIYADISGNLRWTGKQFVVDKDVTINGDVDVSVGNIDFIGDVVIRGNIEEGYEIYSGGNVTVTGMVTGARIIAKGKIDVRMGVVSSYFEAEDISANFFENCTVTARGKLSAQNFMGCEVFCGGKLTASGGKAAIIGGKYTCLSDIEANIIGSETYTRTNLVLGNTAILAEERIELEKKIDEFKLQIEQLGLACDALQAQKKAAGSLPEDREEMLVTSIRAKFVHQKQLQEMKRRVEEINKEIDISNDLRVVARRAIYPGVSIRINSLQYNVSSKCGNCVARVGSSGEIEIH